MNIYFLKYYNYIDPAMCFIDHTRERWYIISLEEGLCYKALGVDENTVYGKYIILEPFYSFIEKTLC